MSNEHVNTLAGAQATVLMSTAECRIEARCRRVARDVDDHCNDDRDHDGHVIAVSVIGEVDLANADAVYAVLHGLIERGPSRIDVELDRLEFIDSFGLSRLITAQQQARAGGVRLAVRGVRPPTRRVFVISGLIDFLGVDDAAIPER